MGKERKNNELNNGYNSFDVEKQVREFFEQEDQKKLDGQTGTQEDPFVDAKAEIIDLEPAGEKYDTHRFKWGKPNQDPVDDEDEYEDYEDDGCVHIKPWLLVLLIISLMLSSAFITMFFKGFNSDMTVNDMRHNVSASQSQITELTASLLEYKTKLEEKEAEIGEKEAEIREKETALSEAQDTIEDLEEEIEDLNTSIEDKDAELEELRFKVDFYQQYLPTVEW